jgi:NosR/NirI family transcriptional regulator, nitrous oxide reductase regulator
MTGARLRGLAVHSCRIAVLVAIVLLVRAKHRDFLRAQPSAAETLPPLEKVRMIWPDAAGLRDSPDAAAVWEVVDADGKQLGSVLQSSPESDRVLGFSGPSNLLIGVDAAGRIAGLAVLSSRDTPEHVARVALDRKFLHGFDGLTLQQVAERRKVDAVTGATLTSLAMVEGIQRRLGGKPASLKFPEPIALKDVQVIFPKADKIVTEPGDPAVALVRGPGDEPMGWVLRTSPAADNTLGYQGPTDALLGFDTHGKVVGLAVAKSYDNEPYVRYVRDDDGFRTLFAGKTLDEMAGLDVKEVEGVTGATMTSQAVAKGVALAAGRKQAAEREPPPVVEAWWSRIAVADVGSAVVILAGIAMAFTSLRGIGWLRVAYQLVVFGYLGLTNGILLSQAQLVGWAQAGVPHGAGALILLTIAALVLPIATRRNVYCTHLCPHGALQQLTLRYARPRVVVPARLRRVLSAIPALLLVVVLVVAMTHLPVSLVDLEPFDAYVLGVAGGATLAIAIVGAVASLFVPMAYCRYGCPTGSLLEWLRRHGRGDRLTLRDGLAAACVVGAFICWRTAI